MLIKRTAENLREQVSRAMSALSATAYESDGHPVARKRSIEPDIAGVEAKMRGQASSFVTTGAVGHFNALAATGHLPPVNVGTGCRNKVYK